jgi:signal transduction histidine kinase
LRVRVYGRRTIFIRLSVTDTGIGIAPEDREQLFDKYAQARSRSTAAKKAPASASTSPNTSSNSTAAKSVESKLGTGSTFSFTLPLGRQRHE